MIARRGILRVLTGLIAAPAVVKVADLMPVRPMQPLVGGLKVGDTLTIEFFPKEPFEPRTFVVTENALTIDDFSRRILEPQMKLLADKIAEDLMRDNPFLPYINHDAAFARGDVFRDLLDTPVTPVAAAALGAAAVLTKNPALSRRGLLTFGGVREEGSDAAPGSSSSDPLRRITKNQETVA